MAGAATSARARPTRSASTRCAAATSSATTPPTSSASASGWRSPTARRRARPSRAAPSAPPCGSAIAIPACTTCRTCLASDASAPVDYARLDTERANPRGDRLDRLPTEKLVSLLIDEEAQAFRAVRAAKREVARAAAVVADALDGGGRLIYVGAGTSGRLGALDAAELPP